MDVSRCVGLATPKAERPLKASDDDPQRLGRYIFAATFHGRLRRRDQQGITAPEAPQTNYGRDLCAAHARFREDGAKIVIRIREQPCG